MYWMFASRPFHPADSGAAHEKICAIYLLLFSWLKAGERFWRFVSLSPLSHTVMQIFAKLCRR
jgi:hypothetical protein